MTGRPSRCVGSRRRRCISPTGPSGSSGICRPPISSTCGRSATTASKPTAKQLAPPPPPPPPLLLSLRQHCSRPAIDSAPIQFGKIAPHPTKKPRAVPAPRGQRQNPSPRRSAVPRKTPRA